MTCSINIGNSFITESNINHNVNELYLELFDLTEFQSIKLKELISNDNVVEIITLEPFERSVTIVVAYRNEDGTFNRYALSYFKALQYKELKPTFKENKFYFEPCFTSETHTILYRERNIHKELMKRSQFIKGLISEFSHYINNTFSTDDECKNIYDKWLSLHNSERLLIYANLDRKVLQKYLSNLYLDEKISFNYPILINDKWYGYGFSIELEVTDQYPEHIFRFFPVCYKGQPSLFSNEESLEWRMPIVSYLKQIQIEVPQVSLMGISKEYFYHYEKSPCKSIECRLEIEDVSETVEIFHKIKSIIKNIIYR